MSAKWRDHYTQKAQDEGYNARSVYKLKEIQAKTKIIKPGLLALDLGCFPGSWTKYLVEQGVTVLGIDFQEPVGIPKAKFITKSVYEVSNNEILEMLGDNPDLIVSDMAPNTTGDRFGDHVRQVELVRCALDISKGILKPNGTLVTKVFDGPEVQSLMLDFRKQFDKVKRFKPDSTRKNSVEFFLIGLGNKGVNKTDMD